MQRKNPVVTKSSSQNQKLEDKEALFRLTSSKKKKLFFTPRNFDIFLKIVKSLDLKDRFRYFSILSKNEKSVIITLSLVLEKILSENLFEFDSNHKKETYEEVEQYFKEDICYCFICQKKYYFFSYDQLKYADDLEEIFRLNSQLKLIQTGIDKSFHYDFDTQSIPEVRSPELETISKKINSLLKKFVEYFGEDAPYRIVNF